MTTRVRGDGYWIGDEDVNGIVIGPMTQHCSFHQERRAGDYVWTERIAGGDFQNDAEAEEWFKAKYPEAYASGVEMRCYDQE